MGNVGEKMNVDFIVSTGDNFYDSGLIDEEDPAFYDSFTNVYTALSLQKQWYSGKHSKHLVCCVWVKMYKIKT